MGIRPEYSGMRKLETYFNTHLFQHLVDYGGLNALLTKRT